MDAAAFGRFGGGAENQWWGRMGLVEFNQGWLGVSWGKNRSFRHCGGGEIFQPRMNSNGREFLGFGFGGWILTAEAM